MTGPLPRNGRQVVWDPSLLRELFELAVDGATTTEVAAVACVSETALRAKWRAAGWNVLHARKDKMRRLFELWRDKKGTVPSLSKDACLSESALRNNWSRNGWYLYPTVSAKVVRKLWQRRLNGESTVALAAEHGRSRSWLAMRWRNLGLKPQKHKNNAILREKSRFYIKAWGLRVDGASWRQIHEALGYGGTVRSLRLAVQRWRVRNGIATDQP